MKKTCRRNKINVDIASYFTPNKIRGIYERFSKMYLFLLILVIK